MSGRNSRLLPPAFLLTSIIPSVVFMVFQTDSMAAGIAICAVGWVVAGALGGSRGVSARQRQWQLFGRVLLVLTLFFVQGAVIESWIGGVDFGRLVSTSLVLLIMFVGASVLAAHLLAASSQQLSAIARFSFVVLTLIGYGAMAGIPSLGAAPYAKPMIVFSEPSYFSFVYLPALIFMVATASRLRQMLYLALALAIAVRLENLTMLVGILGVSCLVLRRTQLLLLLGLVAGAAAILALDLTYFADRLFLSGDSDNLSTLVYLQGWERATINFMETDGVGVGFQQFGIVGSVGNIAQRIFYLAGTTLNLYDGGSTGSKLIAELGVVGVLAIILFLAQVARGGILISRAQKLAVEQRDRRSIFFYSIIIAYSSELFIRGTGYLSPSAFVLLATLIAVPKLRAAQREVRVQVIGLLVTDPG